MYVIFFFKQKTAYEMRISDWSSDVCSSDLGFYHINKSRSAKCAHCGARRIKQQYLTFGQAGQGSCGFIVRSDGDAIGQQAFLQITRHLARRHKQAGAIDADQRIRQTHQVVRYIVASPIEYPGYGVPIRRSQERRVRTECVSTRTSWWAREQEKKKYKQ